MYFYMHSRLVHDTFTNTYWHWYVLCVVCLTRKKSSWNFVFGIWSWTDLKLQNKNFFKYRNFGSGIILKFRHFFKSFKQPWIKWPLLSELRKTILIFWFFSYLITFEKFGKFLGQFWKCFDFWEKYISTPEI